jgi:8-hydroxy-5-deazaflavin:NADPH oxidoreductase
VGVRSRTSKSALALQAQVSDKQVVMLEDSVQGTDAVVFAVPGSAMDEVVARLGSRLDGRLVIDATNNIACQVRNSSAVILTAAPKARVYRAFNSLPAATLRQPRLDGDIADVFYAGPEGVDQEMVANLIRDVGVRPVYVGGPEWFPVVDALGGLFYGLGRSRPGSRLALKLVELEGVKV